MLQYRFRNETGQLDALWAEQGKVNLTFCDDIMTPRRLTVFREPEFLVIHTA